MPLLELKHLNTELRHKTPDEIIEWALTISDKSLVTTSFGKYSAAILSTLYHKDKDIQVVWCDTGYNTEETYKHAYSLINTFNLNIDIYKPLQPRSVIDSFMGLPEIDDPKHWEFTEIVKLEPFRRAISAHQPEVWFTNIRAKQTEFRNSKDILSYSKEGILKVSPFYYWTDSHLDNYLEEQGLPKNDSYFDVTKVLANRECGLHLQ
jgi:phosphoadenosine phosphosulfate reductase